MTDKPRNDWKSKFSFVEGKLSEIENYRDEIRTFNKRILKLEFIHAFVALLLVVITFKQCEILKEQNSKFDIQNNLLEAERRSSLVFLFNNTLDAIDNELKDTSNISRSLSNQLIARVAALSQGLKPYKYYENHKLINEKISPERGQLLKALLMSEIDTLSLHRIFKISDFSYSDMRGAKISNGYMVGGHFDYSDFSNSELFNCNMNLVSSKNVNYQETTFDSTRMILGQFENCDFYKAQFYITTLNLGVFNNADFRKTTIKGCDFGFDYPSNLRLTTDEFINKFSEIGTDFTWVKVDNLEWIEHLKSSRKITKGFLDNEKTYSVKNKNLKDFIKLFKVKSELKTDKRGKYYLIDF